MKFSPIKKAKDEGLNASQEAEPKTSPPQEMLTDSQVKFLKEFQIKTIKETKRLIKEMKL